MNITILLQILLVKRWVKHQEALRLLAQGLSGFLNTPQIRWFLL